MRGDAQFFPTHDLATKLGKEERQPKSKFTNYKNSISPSSNRSGSSGKCRSGGHTSSIWHTHQEDELPKIINKPRRTIGEKIIRKKNLSLIDSDSRPGLTDAVKVCNVLANVTDREIVEQDRKYWAHAKGHEFIRESEDQPARAVSSLAPDFTKALQDTDDEIKNAIYKLNHLAGNISEIEEIGMD